MKKSKTESYLGLARRSGNVISGYQTCSHTISRGTVKLIIVAGDAAENTKDKFRTLCERYGAAFEVYSTSEELSRMTGLPGRGVFGITDKNFADVMIKEIEHEKLIHEA